MAPARSPGTIGPRLSIGSVTATCSIAAAAGITGPAKDVPPVAAADRVACSPVAARVAVHAEAADALVAEVVKQGGDTRSSRDLVV